MNILITALCVASRGKNDDWWPAFIFNVSLSYCFLKTVKNIKLVT